MLICVITAMAQKTLPCSIMSWRYIDFKISQFFNRLLRDLCLLCTLFCISWFLVGFDVHPGHFTFRGASPMYPLSASTHSCSSNQWAKPLQKNLISGTYQQHRVRLSHNISGKNIFPNLILQSTFPFKLEQRKRVAWDGWTLLRDAHISAIYTDEAVIQTATIFPAFKNNLEVIRWVKFQKM